jgi:hypothetical protein
MPILTATEYRTLTGQATSPPSDADITLAIARYQALIEAYLQRLLDQAERTETHVLEARDPLQLAVYPVASIASIAVGTETFDPASFTLNKEAGLLYHDSMLLGQTAAVTYTGGYLTAPYDLKVVLVTLVQAYLTGVNGGVNTLQGARKEVVMGVASIDYGDPVTTILNGAGFAELGPYVSVLDRYRATSFA